MNIIGPAKAVAALLFALTILVPSAIAVLFAISLARSSEASQAYVGLAVFATLVLFLGQAIHAISIVRRGQGDRKKLTRSQILLFLLGPLGVFIVALEAAGKAEKRNVDR